MKTYKEILGFDDKWVLIIGIPLIGFLMSLMMYNDLVSDYQCFFSRCVFISIFYTCIFWMGLRHIILICRDRIPNHEDVVKRIIWQSITMFVGYFLLKKTLHHLVDKQLHEILEIPHPDEIGMTIASLFVAFMVAGIYESIYFYNQLHKTILEKEQLQRENIHSQLEGLKNQVNPHFLFNSLNTLVYIIPENPDKAVKFVQKLSKVYRYILEMRAQKLIPLSEELEFLKSYTFLLKERFGDNLNVEINVPDEFLEDQILPLSLQLLFENAIKHNIISTHRPLNIEVFVEKGKRLIVKNNLQMKKQAMNSTRFGLDNIKNRYRFFSNEEVGVITSQNSFMVVLPLIKAKVPA